MRAASGGPDAIEPRPGAQFLLKLPAIIFRGDLFTRALGQSIVLLRPGGFTGARQRAGHCFVGEG